jgi:hypothetical protein
MAKPQTIKIDDVEYVQKGTERPELSKDGYVIVRCDRAGVFFGYLETTDLANGIVKMKQARRLWYWSGAASLSQLAVDGISKPSECKFPVELEYIQLTGVLEVIPCTEKAVDSIKSVKIWQV